VVPWGEAPRRLDRVRREGPDRDNLRSLQPYTVNVSKRDLAELQAVGAVEVIGGAVQALAEAYLGLYSEAWGLVIPESGPAPDPGAYVV
jgi:hypothetical protein